MSLKTAATAKQTRTSKGKEEALKDVTEVPMKQLNVSVPEDVLHKLKLKAVSEKTTIGALINGWIRENL